MSISNFVRTILCNPLLSYSSRINKFFIFNFERRKLIFIIVNKSFLYIKGSIVYNFVSFTFRHPKPKYPNIKKKI